jgi:YHS domain-containing protein
VLRVLLLAILIIMIARAFWRVVDGVIEAAGGRAPGGRSPARAVKLQRDPVCGTYVAPANAVSVTRGATTLYFCSERCRDEYKGRARA